MTDLLLWLLSAHLISEFLFPDQEWSAERVKRLPHFLAVVTTYLLVLAPLIDVWRFIQILLLAALHLACDLVVRSLPGAQRHTRLLLLDQTLHLVLLVGIAWLLSSHLGWSGHWTGGFVDPWTWRILALVCTGLVTALPAGGVFVRGLLEDTGIGAAGDLEGDDKGMGLLIGYLERFIATVLVIQAQWGALAIVLAAKSIARFKELEDRKFSEYYLVGTLSSLSVAIIIGLIFRILIPSH